MSPNVSFARFACVLGFVLAAGADAAAADLYSKRRIAKTPVPMVAPVHNWTGWYVGGSIGYISGEVTLGAPAAPATTALAPSGVVVTVLGGYDYQFANKVVLGARLAIPIFSIDDSVPSGGVILVGKAKSAVILAGRLGYAVDNFLPYVIGGIVWGRGEATVVGIASVQADHVGTIFGVGIEYPLAPNWTIDANYTFVSMDKETYNFVPFGGLPVVHGWESHNFTVGANYRFSWW